MVRFQGTTYRAKLVRRYKRFLADVQDEAGKLVTVHCANPGSMLGCDTPDSEVLISESPNLKRKLRYTWELVRVGRSWVGINTMMSNRVVEEAVRAGRVQELRGFRILRREVPYGRNSRVDMRLEDPGVCYVEVKNVTLARGKVAQFPDAVTARGSKHLSELRQVVRCGQRAVMFFLINRGDCTNMAPARDIDPHYADELGQAVEQGVEVLAYRARVGVRGIRVAERIPFTLA
jgi:sugar fermentation stimulation protein A